MPNDHCGMRRLYAVYSLVLLLSACQSSDKRHESSVRESQGSFVLTATGLFQAYESDETAADMRYKGKVLYVTGKIVDVESDLMGGYSVSLLADIRSGGIVSCKFSAGQLNYLAKLTTGDYARIKGRFSGKAPVLTVADCVLVNEKGTPLGD